MIITSQNLANIFTGFKGAYARGFTSAKPAWPNVAMKVPSSTESETYAWLGQLPRMREWLGDRIIKNLVAKGMTIVNLDFESTISVPRNKIEDDLYGIFTPLIEEMGRSAAEHPDELVFDLLAKGFSQTCYDGQHFLTLIIRTETTVARSSVWRIPMAAPARRGSFSIRAAPFVR